MTFTRYRLPDLMKCSTLVAKFKPLSGYGEFGARIVVMSLRAIGTTEC
jgi:hypothetical protein